MYGPATGQRRPRASFVSKWPAADELGRHGQVSSVVVSAARITLPRHATAAIDPRPAASTAGAKLALSVTRRNTLVLIRFKKSVRVRLWGRELHSFRKGEVHHVPIVIAPVLFAQGCAEPVALPPALPHAQAHAA